MNYETEEHLDGGSALILSTDANDLTLHNSKFINCSVTCTKVGLSIDGGCVLMRGSFSHRISSSLSVSSCSFTDWYPGSVSYSYPNGGGVGISYTSTSHSIVNSNFTLTRGKAHHSNGGFISVKVLEDSSALLTISNCRLKGDGLTSDDCLHILNCAFVSGGLSICDTEIVNTTSVFRIKTVSGARPIVVTRSLFVNGSLVVESDVITQHDPLLIVDCSLTQFRVESTKSSPDFCSVGTVFNTLPNSSMYELINPAGPCFMIFQSCKFEGCEASRYAMISYSKSISLTMDTAFSCNFTNLTGTYSTLFLIETNGSVLLEDCRFELEQSTLADFRFNKASPSLLNTSSIVGCTSNREIRMTTDGKTLTNCPLFTVIETPKANDEIKLKVDTDENGNPIETMDTLWIEIQSLVSDSSTILSLSDGSFTESEILSIQTDVDIVGNGTESVHVTLDESSRPHTTQLTAELEVKAGANLKLRSMTIIPFKQTEVPSSEMWSVMGFGPNCEPYGRETLQ
ncbi:hypothetical protein BLNAU_20210 [Blattamonas nauphoetae]|uniref:Right handed beta helix domain-containing protein n=1 Tax=Blattamonas nauphoetae TaxID=2049346 RepID=A0ABQ9WZC9_9EUKA|nr:hypothetical protein BLNAU_20210 [Blattamonas nauphoetae]